MKLRKLSVNQFKRFTEPTRLGELSDGLNLVVGPNELGKSTLLDALRAALFERYSSRAQPIIALQNARTSAAPVVELVFDVNGAEYTLTKRFVKKAYARLRCPDGTLLEADAAEDKLRNLLGFAEAGSRGANSETLGMWGVLWVQQGQSFGRPDLPDSALASLSAGLESEVGAVLGGRRGRELPQVIEQRRSELITEARRQPRGKYKATLGQIEEMEQRLSEQQQQRQVMSDTLEQLATAESRLKRLDDGNRDRIDQVELSQARDQLGEMMRRESQLEAAQSELQNRQRQLDQARCAQSERASQRSELVDTQEKLRQECESLEELQQNERESAASLRELRQTVDNAEAAVEAAEKSEAKWRFTLDLITCQAELADLLRRKSDVAAAQQRLNDAQHQAEQIQVTDKSLQRIRHAANTADQTKAQLNVATTRISFDIPSDRLAGIEAAGTPLTHPHTTIEAVERVAIIIPERGRILIDPAIADRDHLLHAEREARTALRAALKQAGAQSLAEAEVLRDQRRDFEAAVMTAQRELERLAAAGGALTLRNRIDELRQLQVSLRSECETADLPQRDHTEVALRSAQTDLRNARDEERIARAAVEERQSAVAECTAEVLRAQSAVEFQTEIVQRREERLCSDAESAPDEQLDAATHAAAQAVTEQQQIVSARQEEWSAGSRPQLQARIKRLESAIGRRANLRGDSRTEIARLRERIVFHDSAGIEEAIDHTQNELEQATRRCCRLKREIEVLDLLCKTLRACETEAKERYLAPVLNRVRPYLQMLFANAEISMDEDLNITGMSRGGGYEERFDHLSMGTQEQIAVLVRLAFAEMLVDQGAPAAVILDDALVFSDDQRMRLMFDILSHAAMRVQILVFTCREQLFEDLGAHQLQLASADHESLRSA